MWVGIYYLLKMHGESKRATAGRLWRICYTSPTKFIARPVYLALLE